MGAAYYGKNLVLAFLEKRRVLVLHALELGNVFVWCPGLQSFKYGKSVFYWKVT
jgi:hypothetical protein